jgi:biopolymer transport protein ExbD
VTGKMFVPLVDLVFLTLGSVLGAMTQMQRVEAIDVEVARVGAGSTVVRRGDLRVVTLAADGLTLDGERVEAEDFPRLLSGRSVLLRADRTLPNQRTFELLAELTRAGASVSVELDPQPARQPAPGS